jgi:hypothetical protein
MPRPRIGRFPTEDGSLLTLHPIRHVWPDRIDPTAEDEDPTFDDVDGAPVDSSGEMLSGQRIEAPSLTA